MKFQTEACSAQWQFRQYDIVYLPTTSSSQPKAHLSCHLLKLHVTASSGFLLRTVYVEQHGHTSHYLLRQQSAASSHWWFTNNANHTHIPHAFVTIRTFCSC